MGSGELMARLVKKVRAPRPTIREFISEFFGMYVLITFGLGSVVTYVINPKLNSFMSLNIAWGFAVAMGVWTSYAISGGHLNPAVTLTWAIIGKLQWFKVPVYWLAQYLGAFMAALTVFMVYRDALDHFDGGVRSVTGPNATAGIFATYPQEFLSTMGGFTDQMTGTQLLVIGILAVTDADNAGAPRGVAPLCIGFVVTLIGMTFGMNCGYAINPARDLGPRLFTAIAGWGTEVFTAGGYWFWIPIIAPHIGAILGAVTYLTMISANLPSADGKRSKKNSANDVTAEAEELKTMPFTAS